MEILVNNNNILFVCLIRLTAGSFVGVSGHIFNLMRLANVSLSSYVITKFLCYH